MIPRRPPLFKYDARTLGEIETALTNERLAPYVAQTASFQEAVDLYVWNEAISAALMFPLRVVEVTLRNALDAQLRAYFAYDWFKNPHFIRIAVSATKKDLLSDISREAAALVRSHSNAYVVQPGDLRDKLNFGFWTTLLDPTFEPSLWSPTLYRAFPRFAGRTGATLRRPPVATRFDSIRKLRNKIAHNEALIFRRNLLQDYEEVLEATDWIHPGITDWVDHHARVRFVLSVRERPRHLA